jgi:hypothetical protein
LQLDICVKKVRNDELIGILLNSGKYVRVEVGVLLKRSTSLSMPCLASKSVALL